MTGERDARDELRVDDVDAETDDATVSGREDAAAAEEPQAPAPEERSAGELAAALAEAESQRDEYLDHLRRTQAEFQNFRKRTMREGSTQREQGATEVLARLVDVLDDFELAVLAGENADDVAALRKGVEMVYGKLVEVVRSFGLEKIGATGVAFDPELHEAVQSVESDDPLDEPVVTEVLRPGYLANGRVVRAAMVKVER